mmetsp:Transcript_34464/g.50547  ORF Transcript_34464/g.50547 Transcript_34464/m.50547 type:complete len:682 (+) Transcript_34464:250-2295(+)
MIDQSRILHDTETLFRNLHVYSASLAPVIMGSGDNATTTASLPQSQTSFAQSTQFPVLTESDAVSLRSLPPLPSQRYLTLRVEFIDSINEQYLPSAFSPSSPLVISKKIQYDNEEDTDDDDQSVILSSLPNDRESFRNDIAMIHPADGHPTTIERGLKCMIPVPIGSVIVTSENNGEQKGRKRKKLDQDDKRELTHVGLGVRMVAFGPDCDDDNDDACDDVVCNDGHNDGNCPNLSRSLSTTIRNPVKNVQYAQNAHEEKEKIPPKKIKKRMGKLNMSDSSMEDIPTSIMSPVRTSLLQDGKGQEGKQKNSPTKERQCNTERKRDQQSHDNKDVEDHEKIEQNQYKLASPQEMSDSPTSVVFPFSFDAYVIDVDQSDKISSDQKEQILSKNIKVMALPYGLGNSRESKKNMRFIPGIILDHRVIVKRVERGDNCNINEEHNAGESRINHTSHLRGESRHPKNNEIEQLQYKVSFDNRKLIHLGRRKQWIPSDRVISMKMMLKQIHDSLAIHQSDDKNVTKTGMMAQKIKNGIHNGDGCAKGRHCALCPKIRDQVALKLRVSPGVIEAAAQVPTKTQVAEEVTKTVHSISRDDVDPFQKEKDGRQYKCGRLERNIKKNVDEEHDLLLFSADQMVVSGISDKTEAQHQEHASSMEDVAAAGTNQQNIKKRRFCFIANPIQVQL